MRPDRRRSPGPRWTGLGRASPPPLVGAVVAVQVGHLPAEPAQAPRSGPPAPADSTGHDDRTGGNLGDPPVWPGPRDVDRLAEGTVGVRDRGAQVDQRGAFLDVPLDLDVPVAPAPTTAVRRLRVGIRSAPPPEQAGEHPFAALGFGAAGAAVGTRYGGHDGVDVLTATGPGRLAAGLAGHRSAHGFLTFDIPPWA